MACVFFDCDSTLVSVEGLDELARQQGCFEDVAQITEQAMAGEINYRQAVAKRLDLIQPSAAMVNGLAETYLRNVVAGVGDALAQLREAGHDLAIVSGGPLQSILPLAETLGFTNNQVHAIKMEFDADGAYAGFDRSSALLADDGKAQICHKLCGAKGSLGIMVGDARTDACVREAGLRFIHFAGIANRPGLAELADASIAQPSMATLPRLVAGMLA